MAHEVTLAINSKFVLNKDVEVEVKQDGKKLGTLMISKGNIEWLPSKNSVNKHRMSWARFAQLMVAEGRQEKVAK